MALTTKSHRWYTSLATSVSLSSRTQNFHRRQWFEL